MLARRRRRGGALVVALLLVLACGRSDPAPAPGKGEVGLTPKPTPGPTPGACESVVRCEGLLCDDRNYRRLVELLERAFSAAGQADVLILSGGGSKGAWGAGVLNGWSTLTSGMTRPTFEVVTGVSTGAVQATFAFLGKSKDQDLEIGYTTTTNSDVYGPPYPLPVFPRNLEGLRQTLKSYIPDSMIDEVGQVASSTQRKLFVGTVNLESAEFVSWDMTCLAKAKQYDLYRNVILASSANPAGLWPIDVMGQMHVDGGVRYRIYVETVMQASGEAADMVPAAAGKKRLFYIINGKLKQKGPAKVSSWNPLSIVERSLDIALRESIFGSLYASWHLLNSGSDKWKFYGSAIPNDQSDVPDADDYDTVKMTKLLEAGENWAKTQPWAEGIPKLTPMQWGCDLTEAKP